MKQYGKMVVFENDYKKTDKHPVQRAKITITEDLKAGEYEVGLFRSTSKNGRAYLSGKLQEAWKKEESQAPINQLEQNKGNGFMPQPEDDDDGIPF